MGREQFIDLISREQESLRRFLLALCCGDSAKADDLAQETLLRAYVSSGSFLGLSKFRTWLLRIGYNCFIDSIRKRMPTKTGLDDPAAIAIPDANSADAQFRYEQLYRALAKLPEKERACISLHYFEDLAIKDIAQILHLPTGTVKYHLSVGRAHLKTYMSL